MTAVRTSPHPARSWRNIGTLATIAVSLVFNVTLSGLEYPYRGVFYEADRLAFMRIWRALAKEGYVSVTDLNFDERYFVKTLRSYMRKGDAWDDRFTCAGLAMVLVHVARAIIGLSIVWEKEREELDAEDEEEYKAEQYFLDPSRIHERAIQDVSDALGIDLEVVGKLIGGLSDLVDLPVTSMFPTMKWVEESPRKSERPPSLWDAFYMEVGAEDDDNDSDYGKKPRKTKAKAKKSSGRKSKYAKA